MTMGLTTSTGLVGIGVALIIVFLLRRDHIFILQAIFWLVVAILAALLGLWPNLIDHLASTLGISYPPSALLLGAVVVLFIKALSADITHTRLERQVRRLNQRIALLEATQHQDEYSKS